MHFYIKRWTPDASIAVGLLAGNLLLLAPHLATDFTAQAWNNDYILIAMSRMFRALPWSWNALWYCGFPSGYAYPPLFHTVAGVMPFASLGRAYHVVSGFCYALAPPALYLMGLQLFRSRFSAALAATAYSIFPSPLYLLPEWANLAGNFHYAPWPFIALVGHGEAPHILSLALTPLAVAAAWQGRWRLASLWAGAVFLTNWPGMIGLLFAFAAVGVARGRNPGYGRAAVRVLIAAGVGYGLAAFWITAGFLHSTATLARAVLPYREHPSAPWNATTWAILTGAGVLLGLAFWRRTPPVASFLLAWLALSGTPVIAFTLAGNHLLPMPWRYVMEFNMALIVAAASLACLGPRWRFAFLAAAVVLGGFAARGFVRHAWRLQPRTADVRELVSFQIANWLAQNAPGSRVFAAGELNAAMNAWTDVAQVLGGHQGVSNLLVEAAHKEVMQGCAGAAGSAEIAELWLRALGAHYLVVHGAASREYHHWFRQPERFSALPVVWTNGAGDSIRRLPAPDVQEAVVVDRAMLGRLPLLRSTNDREFLTAYVALAQGKRAARLRWTRSDAAELEADLQTGEAVLVKVNHDRGWRVDGARTRPDPIGFLLLDLPAGHQRARLRFATTWDVWFGRAVTLATVVLLLLRVPLYVPAFVALIATAAAYALLAVGSSPHAAVAADTFRRVRPPMISPGGIVDGVTAAQPPLARGRPISIYGLNFGEKHDLVRLWVGSQQAHILYRQSNQLNIQLPDDAPPAAEIAVEVNGCRGNSFAIQIRD